MCRAGDRGKHRLKRQEKNTNPRRPKSRPVSRSIDRVRTYVYVHGEGANARIQEDGGKMRRRMMVRVLLLHRGIIFPSFVSLWPSSSWCCLLLRC